uniref:Exportin-5 n=1 Tax=Setaria digitata TaxID=48799 RepID=A0A915PYS2_9BILA
MRGKKVTISIAEEFGENQIREMERMAELLEMTPTPGSHLAALWYFRDLGNRITADQCRTVIERVSNEFLICTMVETTVFILLRDWTKSEAAVKKEYFDYFLGSALLKFRKSLKVRSEMLKACAKLVKRSVFDGQACNFNILACKLYVLLTDDEIEFHEVTYEFILKIFGEFDTYWRISDLGVPYEFQFRAKEHFEEKGLLQIFSKFMHIVPRFCIFTSNLKSPVNLSMAHYFLRLSNLIFMRNYGIHHIPIKNDAVKKGPPKTWKIVFMWTEFLHIFFNLHKIFRGNQRLSLLTLGCLTQLTLIRDVVLPDEIPSVDTRSSNFPDVPYYTTYDREAVMPELYNYCLMIGNILTAHPVHSLARAEASFPTFLSFIPELTEILSVKLLYLKRKDTKDESGKEVVKEEYNSSLKWAYISGLQHLFKGWLIVIHNSVFIQQLLSYSIDFAKVTIIMISSVMQTMFSVPFGDREELTIPFPDREIFKELLIKIGYFSAFFSEQMLPRVFTILAETLEEFLSTMETEMNQDELNMWRENMHWILLTVGHVLVEENKNRQFVWQKKLLLHYKELIKEEQFDPEASADYIEACISAPQELTDPTNVDVVIKIIGTVLAWCSIEDDLLKDHGPTAISLELCCTSLWCIKRLLSAIGLHIEKSDKDDRLAKISRNLSQTLVDFSLQKAFRVLEVLPDEKKACTDAIELLSTLASTLYRETSRSIFLFSYLSAIQINQLIVRGLLLKALIQIASIINDEAKQQALFEMILIPLRNKFVSKCENLAGANENIDDLLDCFCAVIDATQKCSANFLFAYLMPILKCSVKLLSTHKDSPVVISAVFQFFDCLTKRLYLFCDDHADMSCFYGILLELVRAFGKEHVERYQKADSKEKGTELILLLEILINTLSRKNRPINLSTGMPLLTEKCAHIITVANNMLLSIIKFDFLKLPLFRKNLYRFFKCSTTIGPECIATLPEERFTLFVEYLRRGLQTDCEKDNLLANAKDGFEQETSINAARTIADLGAYFTRHTRNEEAIKILSTLIEPAFMICLDATWQEDAESLATSTALYSLLCCDEGTCKTYVKKLMSREENYLNRTNLRPAFRALMSLSARNRFEQQEKRDFHNRLKQFLTKTEGLLVIE